ncbi:Uncharacterised protein [Salmonella enterica subsp. enterica]|uniref:Uncharacterized protein n=1 Tax=Salmonella enterica I TaxID=59201 RepID=A0A379WMC9_SALET|nr:Uncharacterised protein [Salmonella enterica subsp. enterica]
MPRIRLMLELAARPERYTDPLRDSFIATSGEEEGKLGAKIYSNE